MRLRRLVVLIAVLLVAIPAPSPAFDGPCSGSAAARSKKTCIFPARETPITMRAQTTGSNVSVHIWVTVSGYPEIPPLMDCSASGSGFVDCADAFPDSTTAIPLKPHPLAPGPVDLVCHFEGTGDWKYGCDAG